MGEREKLVKMAQSYVGCKESDGSHRTIINIYNAHKPLARGYAVKYTDEWCATFVSAMAIKCELTDIMPTECGCEKMIELYKKLGSWHENEATHKVRPGDVIFYDWQDNGVGDNKGVSDHVGIVEKVTGNTITVIEGNIREAVGRRTLKVNGRYIRGYGVPKFKEEKDSAEAASPAKVEPAQSYDKTLAGVYTTSTSLNMRTGAGTAKEKILTIPRGAAVINYGYYSKDSSGTKWLYVAYNDVTGFCSSKYLKK